MNKEKIKIMLVTSGYPQSTKSFKGIFLHKIIKELNKEEFDIHVIVPQEGKDQVTHFEGVRIHSYKSPETGFGDFKIMNIFKWILYYILMKYQTTKYIKLLKPDIVHGAWGFPSGMISEGVANTYKIPNIITLLGAGMRKGQKIPILRTVLKKSLDRTDCIVSDDYSEMFDICDKIGVKNKNRVHIPAGTNINFFKPKTPKKELLRKYKDKNVLLLVGWFRILRGQHFVIKCMPTILKKHPNTKLLFAGTGPTMDLVKELTEKLKITNNVDFLGNVNNKDLPDYYNLANIVLIASDRTNYSTAALFEAAACGRPVVATDIKDTDLLVKQDVNGLFAKFGDIKGFSGEVIKLLDNPTLQNKFGKNMRELSIEQFSVDDSIKMYSQVYKRTLNLRKEQSRNKFQNKFSDITHIISDSKK